MARVAAEMARSLADALIIPFNVSDYAWGLELNRQQLDKYYGTMLSQHVHNYSESRTGLLLSPLLSAAAGSTRSIFSLSLSLLLLLLLFFFFVVVVVVVVVLLLLHPLVVVVVLLLIPPPPSSSSLP